MIPLLLCTASMTLNLKGIVRSIPSTTAVLLMQKWSLEYIVSADENHLDLHIFERMTDDSISGPFKLDTNEHEHHAEIKNIQSIARWVEAVNPDARKGIYLASIEGDDSMLAFVEVHRQGIHVNGFLPRPFLDAEMHNAARSILALQLLDMASEADTNIVFRFSE